MNCTGNGWINPGTHGTQATALRDRNYILLETTAWISVWYSGLFVDRVYGTYEGQWVVSGYHYAYCKLEGSTVRWGHCTTDWHD